MMRGDERADVVRMSIGRHQIVTGFPRPHLKALVHPIMLPGEDDMQEACCFRRARHQQRFVARVRTQAMIDREHDEFRPVASRRTPLRGQMHERKTVGPTGDGERDAREMRERREQHLGVVVRDRRRRHGQPAFPAAVFAYASSLLPIDPGTAYKVAIPWAGALGIEFAFLADGLSTTFVLLISGIGALVVVYASGYLGPDPRLGRFYVFLLSFMGAMLGVVLADKLEPYESFTESHAGMSGSFFQALVVCRALSPRARAPRWMSTR